MYQAFNADITRMRSLDLHREADEARLVRAARDQGRSSRRQQPRRLEIGLSRIASKKVVVAAALVVCASGGVAAATAAASPSTAGTPNSCITLNGGDYNACNVGNSGRGDLPYQPVHVSTPNECILANGGDDNACNLGNSGGGDLPYQPPNN
jgi:hypothetical protein